MKVKHRFKYIAPHVYTHFRHCISFKLLWRGEWYGQFMLFNEMEWECPYYCLRQLLREKHFLLQNMRYVEEHLNETI